MSDMQLYKWRDATGAWDKLNAFARDVQLRLNRGLTFAGNVNSQIVNVEFVGPAATLSVQTRYTSPPMGVLLMQLTSLSAGAASNVAFGWQYEGTGLVTTTAFSGLAAGRYGARLLVLGA